MLYCLTPAFAPPQGSYAFSTWSSSEDGTHALLNYFHAMGWKKLAVITPAGANGFYDFRVGNQRGLTIKDCIVVSWDPRAQAWQPVSGPGGLPRR